MKLLFVWTTKAKFWIIPEKFTTKYESVIISGDTTEVEGDEKYLALKGFLEKFSSNHMDKGIQYLENDINKTVVIRMDIKQISGKRGKE